MLFTPHPSPLLESEKTFSTTPTSTPRRLPSINDRPSKGLSVVVPAYNEDDRLGIMIDEAMEYFGTPRSSFDTPQSASGGRDKGKGREVFKDGVEILVVNDGSTDKTTRTAQTLAQKWSNRPRSGDVDIRVLTLTRNRGKGGAVQHVSGSSIPNNSSFPFSRAPVRLYLQAYWGEAH